MLKRLRVLIYVAGDEPLPDASQELHSIPHVGGCRDQRHDYSYTSEKVE